MRSRKTLAPFTVGLAFALAMTACSKSTSDQGAGDGTGGTARTVRIKALDALRFEPASVTVTVGETVRFVVTNTGSTKHEFFVGDEAAQMAHEEEMGMGASMGPSDMRMAALELAAGETKETTVTFDEAGSILYGCHEPGHYEGGMVGTIAVAS